MNQDQRTHIFLNKVKQARRSLDGMTLEEKKLAINILQQTLNIGEDAEETSIALHLDTEEFFGTLNDETYKLKS
ncbi:hypothetical protein ACTWQB_14845 [Piscibacillus sp. B03]|uniref:hypothetical protein n=1 Tax=Piscibacillus sp. B03 TaxID=3457430 RepID=UPI003FCDA1A2